MTHGLPDESDAAAADPATMVKKERTVLTSLVIDIVLWIPDIAAAALSGSITMFADVLKCGNEILATFFAYLTLRKMNREKGGAFIYDYGMGKFENLTGIITGGVMFISLALVFFTAIHRIYVPEELVVEGAFLGIGLMALGVFVNTWLWFRNLRLYRQSPSPIMDSQWRLFRTKAFSDASVLSALVLSMALHDFWWSLYIDPVASFVIVGFLLQSGYRVIMASLPDLLDKTLDESLQLVIVRELAAFFHEYEALHGVRSRRSGNRIYIEIHLEFAGDRKMCEVQEVINRIKGSLEAKIPRSEVSIVPASAACGAGAGEH
jgi:cation diffusion facilitator family transporter